MFAVSNPVAVTQNVRLYITFIAVNIELLEIAFYMHLSFLYRFEATEARRLFISVGVQFLWKLKQMQ